MQEAAICDVDGTLALFERGRVSPYNRDFMRDTPNIPIVRVLAALTAQQNLATILVSGRSARFRATTETWLRHHAIRFDALYMRSEGDNRKDVLVKQELYEQHIRGRFKVLLVLDDRTSVVHLWRSLGLVCFQVAPGDF